MNITYFIPKTLKIPLIGYNYNKMPASSWIRCLQLIPHLSELGIKVSVNQMANNTHCAVFLRRWSQTDFTMAQKLKKNGIKIFIDTPVNYFSEEVHPAFTTKRCSEFLKFAKLADSVICASENIAQFANKKGFKARCIEDSIDTSMIKKIHATKQFDLIWAGTSEKAQILNFLMPVINANKWSLNIIAEKKPRLDGSFHFTKWNYSTFFTDLTKGKIGIFPRNNDNDYDRGHSIFKVGVCLASHIPVIYSPVPSYAKIANSRNSIMLNKIDSKLWETTILKALSGEHNFNFTENPVESFSCPKIADKYQVLFQGQLQNFAKTI